jgi:hypothetical protein
MLPLVTLVLTAKLFLRFDFSMLNPGEPFKWTGMGFTLHEDMNVIITKREAKALG